jgi:hypothetical protein
MILTGTVSVPGGAVTTILVAEIGFSPVARVVRNQTDRMKARPAPVMVTVVPALPVAELSPLIAGTGR